MGWLRTTSYRPHAFSCTLSKVHCKSDVAFSEPWNRVAFCGTGAITRKHHPSFNEIRVYAEGNLQTLSPP